MARRLRLIIDSDKYIKEGDVLFFNFKSHIFRSKVGGGGLLYSCTWTAPKHLELKIFPQRTFESLTDWSETCIQEKLQEYHTRYSAWRRVRHQKTGLTMEMIYKKFTEDKLMQNVVKLSHNEYQHLLNIKQEKILQAKETNDELIEKLTEWNTWFKNKFPNMELPIKPLAKPEEQQSTETKVDSTPVQPIVLDSPNGTYVVLHRMKQTNSKETLNKIKNMGVKGFRNFVNTFMEQHKAWVPPTPEDNSPEWYTNGVEEALKNPAKVARFIHEFFKH